MNVTKPIKDVGFGIDEETNLKIVDLLDITFNRNNRTYRPYQKSSKSLLYLNKSSKYPPNHQLNTKNSQ